MVLPEMKPACSEHRYAHVAPNSSGRPKRPAGMLWAIRRRASSYGADRGA
jgi:hypothetical protein